MKIAIIGAGFSGTLVAAQLLRTARTSVEIHLYDRSLARFGRGVAYGTDDSCHLLNVPAGNLSAWPDDPGHFLNWCRQHADEWINPPWICDITESSFMPRKAYGRYLGELLAEAEKRSAPGVTLSRHGVEVTALERDADGFILRTSEGAAESVDLAVLAVGNFRPGDPPVRVEGFYDSARYFGDPWASGTLETVLNTRSCLFLGSGLTMADWAITLSREGYRGTMHVLSRRGLWPAVHRPGLAKISPPDDPLSFTQVRTGLAAVRRWIREGDGDWRQYVDALRPYTQGIWANLDAREQRRFLRHVRPFWDLHRHRIAPVVGEQLARLVESGQLVRHAGRVSAFSVTAQGVDVVLRRRGSTETESLTVDAVLNCSGSESDYRKLNVPLIAQLREQGLISPDETALGLKSRADGALIGADGQSCGRLFTLGPPQKGLLWECTAIPEVRVQAQRLATRLLPVLAEDAVVQAA